MKRILIATLLFALCGCDNPDAWEFCQQVPSDTTPERLMEIRQLLTDNGYKRFKIYTIDYGRAIIIHATAKDERREDRAQHVAGLGVPTMHTHWYSYDWSVATAGVFTVRMERVLDDCEESEVAK